MRRDPSDLAAAAAQELEDRFAANERRIARLEHVVIFWFFVLAVLWLLS